MGGGQFRSQLTQLVLQMPVFLAGIVQLAGAAAQLELRNNMVRQYAECLALVRAKLARDFIKDAERSQRMPIGGNQRRPGIEANFGFGNHHRAAGKTRVQCRVGHDKQARLGDGIRAKRMPARGLADGEPDLRLEPLPIFVHQRDQGHRSFTNRCGQLRQIVKHLLRHSVEHFVLPKNFKPFRLRCCRRGNHVVSGLRQP